MAKIIKKSEQRRRDERQLQLYNQAHQRLLNGKNLPPIVSGDKSDLLNFVSQRIDETIKELL